MDKKILDQVRSINKNELDVYLDQIWPSFLVFCRVMDRKKRPGQDVHVTWKPPMPHPLGGSIDLLIEPLIKERMEKSGFVRPSVLAAGFLSLFWEAGSVPSK